MSAVAQSPEVEETLTRVFGFTTLRPGQDEIVAAVLDGADVLAVMPTGAGKSLCYQLPALIRGRLTVVVSPLIALMRDQVEQLRAKGVAAAALHSGNSSDEQFAVEQDLTSRRLKLLYVSPERLLRPGTLALIKNTGCDRLAVDEAHCVSQWGHDFRPEYMDLGHAAAELGEPQIVALTASADPATRDEIVSRLFSREPRRFVRSFDRPNLHLAITRKTDALQQIKAFVGAHPKQSGIIYAASRRGTEKIAELLSDDGVQALAYHAGMDAARREAHHDAFLKHRGMVMVATIAFGMGIDKPDVRFVCHADLAGSVEGYYQEIGRAGRDGARADTLMLWNEADVRLRERQIALSDAPPERKIEERRRLATLLALCETPRCRRQTLLAAFGESIAPCDFCDMCERRRTMFDGVVAAQKAMSALLRTSGRFFPGHLANLLIGKMTDAIQRHGHDSLPTFGVGQEFSAPEWRSIFRQIQASGLITQYPGDGGRWHVTEAGRKVLSGEENLELVGPDTAPRAARARGMLKALAADDGATPRTEVPPPLAETLSTRDQRLFAALKAARTEIARARKMPPYVIFHDSVLREIASARPRTARDLAAIKGVGPAKIEAYGANVLGIVEDMIRAEEE